MRECSGASEAGAECSAASATTGLVSELQNRCPNFAFGSVMRPDSLGWFEQFQTGDRVNLLGQVTFIESGQKSVRFRELSCCVSYTFNDPHPYPPPPPHSLPPIHVHPPSSSSPVTPTPPTIHPPLLPEMSWTATWRSIAVRSTSAW